MIAGVGLQNLRIGLSKSNKKSLNSHIFSTPNLIKYILAYSLLACISLSAQHQLPIYTDYLMDNYYLMHPAMAGAHFQGIKARATHRSQWQQIENAPSLQTFNAHSRLNEKSGIGTVFYNDGNGYHKRLGGLITYAHHLNFYRAKSEINQLSFGLSIGVMNDTHDQSSFDPSLSDPLVTGFKVNTSGLHIDIGFSYNILGFYAHLTAKNLLFTGYNRTDDLKMKTPRALLMNTGYFIPFSNTLSIEPSVLVYDVQYASTLGYDINLKSHHSFDSFYSWLGLSYRANVHSTIYSKDDFKAFSQRHKQFTIMVGIRISTISFSYAYSASLENVQLATFGGHQLTLGIDIFGKKYRPVTVRGIL